MAVTSLKKITFEELLEEFDESVRDQLRANWARDDVTHMIIFECLDFWSSNLGKKTALIIGPGCSIKALDEARELHLGDVPSRHQHPTRFAEKA